MVKQRQRLGELLIAARFITVDNLEDALIKQQSTGEKLGQILVKEGFLTEEQLMPILAKQLSVPYIPLAQRDLDAAIVRFIPWSLVQRYKILAVAKTGNRLTVVMTDPSNLLALEDVHLATGFEISPAIASEKEILQAIHQVFGVKDLVNQAVKDLKAEEAQPIPKVQAASDAPIVAIVASLLKQAVREEASDIHIETLADKVRVRYRIDGILKEVLSFPLSMQAPLIARLKIMSNMDIAEKRRPQDGRIQMNEAGRSIDLRLATLPTIKGEKIVIRILDQAAVPLPLEKLGLSQQNLQKYERLYRQSHGLLLMTGPTGSGKTTTLYATLQILNQPEENLVTIENPVEYHLPGVNQVQVNEKVGITFATGLRAILRQDPNIIMVGEIRDKETANIAVRAALTGHLVFSTLHASSAVGAVTRLLDMGIDPFLVTASLIGIVAQRLVRRLCPVCKEPFSLLPHSPEVEFLKNLGEVDRNFFKSRGCPHCGRSSYRGRLAIQEILPFSRTIREAISRGVSVDELSEIAGQEGFISIKKDGVCKAKQGITTIAEVMRAVRSEL